MGILFLWGCVIQGGKCAICHCIDGRVAESVNSWSMSTDSLCCSSPSMDQEVSQDS